MGIIQREAAIFKLRHGFGRGVPLGRPQEFGRFSLDWDVNPERIEGRLVAYG
jgi:hypothetical protein